MLVLLIGETYETFIQNRYGFSSNAIRIIGIDGIQFVP